MSLKSKEKSVADTVAYEHLVALPNRSARRLPQNGAGRFAYPGFQRATNTPAHWAPPDRTMTEAGAEFKFCCRNDSSATKKQDLCTTLRQAQGRLVTEARRKQKLRDYL